MLAKVEIRHVGGIASEVIVGGQDISKKLSAITYEHRAGELPKLILEMVPGTFNLASNGCEVKKSRDTAATVPRPSRSKFWTLDEEWTVYIPATCMTAIFQVVTLKGMFTISGFGLTYDWNFYEINYHCPFFSKFRAVPTKQCTHSIHPLSAIQYSRRGNRKRGYFYERKGKAGFP